MTHRSFFAWTAQDERILLERWRNYVPLSQIAIELGRTRGAVKTKLKRLRIAGIASRPSRNHNVWCPDRTADFVELWRSGAPAALIAERLGVTYKAVLAKSQHLRASGVDLPIRRSSGRIPSGLTREEGRSLLDERWAEIVRLRREGLSAKAIGQKLGIPRGTVLSSVHRMRKRRGWIVP